MISQVLKPFLWSYDFEKLDRDVNKKTIIQNVLNYGTSEATDELFKIYSKTELLEVLRDTKRNNFNRKSYSFWTKVIK